MTSVQPSTNSGWQRQPRGTSVLPFVLANVVMADKWLYQLPGQLTAKPCIMSLDSGRVRRPWPHSSAPWHLGQKPTLPFPCPSSCPPSLPALQDTSPCLPYCHILLTTAEASFRVTLQAGRAATSWGFGTHSTRPWGQERAESFLCLLFKCLPQLPPNPIPDIPPLS